MKKRVILISGFAQTGKDTLARAIQSKMKTETSIQKFATSLRKCVWEAFNKLGMSVDVWTEDPIKKALLRPVLVEFAVYARNADPDIFARHLLLDTIKAFNLTNIRTLVISDCRYTNEAQLFKRAGKDLEWEVVRVHIERKGTLPACAEEQTSVFNLNAQDEANYFVSFADGDLEGIERFADMLVKSFEASEQA